MVIMRNPYSGGQMTVSISNVERLVQKGWATVEGHTPSKPVAPRGDQTVTEPPKEKSPAASVSERGVTAPPKGNATRAAWREYAESLGVETKGLNRAQLRDAVAAHQKRG